MRFFWQRKQTDEPAESSDHPRRRHYRTRPSEDLGVASWMHLPSGERLTCQVVDISGTGMAVKLPLDHDPVLAPGDVIELQVEASGHRPVKTPGEVVFSTQDGDRHIRYGFTYTNLGNLYAQLDDFYARLFNRRQGQRSAAVLDQRIPLRLSWSGFWLDAEIHDISEGGIGVVLDRREATLFQGVERISASFRLESPRTAKRGAARDDDELLEGHLEVVHRSERPELGGILVGLRFVFDESDGGFGRHEDLIRSFVHRRNRRIEGWEGSWSAAG